MHLKLELGHHCDHHAGKAFTIGTITSFLNRLYIKQILYLASCLCQSCERDDEQANEFLGQLIKIGHVLKQDVVNVHAHTKYYSTSHVCCLHNQCPMLYLYMHYTMTSSCLQDLLFHCPVYNILYSNRPERGRGP